MVDYYREDMIFSIFRRLVPSQCTTLISSIFNKTFIISILISVYAMELVPLWRHPILCDRGSYFDYRSQVSMKFDYNDHFRSNENWNSTFDRHFKVASSILVVFMLSSWATTGYIAFSYKHIPNNDDPLALFDKIYDKPWTRLGPYLIGMSVGWLLFKTNCKIRMRMVKIFEWWDY